jgi:predicted  nucleic acid-binding Zn-ribbon protein
MVTRCEHCNKVYGAGLDACPHCGTRQFHTFPTVEDVQAHRAYQVDAVMEGNCPLCAHPVWVHRIVGTRGFISMILETLEGNKSQDDHEEILVELSSGDNGGSVEYRCKNKHSFTITRMWTGEWI